MVLFISNFINHHQIPFCNAMYKLTNGEFRFIGTEPMSEERVKMGYKDLSDELPYVINDYDGTKLEEIKKLVNDSDFIITGSAPKKYFINRIVDNKLVLKYSERYFKQGRWRILDPRVLHVRYSDDFKLRKKNVYMLCASAYTAPDCRFIFSYPKKTFKWGYFPQVKEYDNIEEIISKKTPNSILWVARLIKFKHPEKPIMVAKKLKEEGYNFKLTFIGSGVLEEKMKLLVRKNNLEDEIFFLGSMSPEEVRKHMEQSEIFLFTSDKNEGWGAVLNESMNSCCAVVADKHIGSVPYLIKNGENGFMFNGKVNDLYKKVKYLLDNKEKRVEFSKNAYLTLKNTWNADVAAERVLKLADSIKNGKRSPYIDGPCSED